MRKLAESLLLFGLIASLPFLKVYLLGNFDAAEQTEYIRIYFWLQFCVPLIDFGYYWSVIRKRVESTKTEPEVGGLSLFGIIASGVMLFYNYAIALMLILAVLLAWHNFRLQLARIEGESKLYYSIRLSKIIFDLTFVTGLYVTNLLKIETILAAEFLSVALTQLLFSKHFSLDRGFGLIVKNRLFSMDYLYVLLKVFRSNVVRLTFPIVFLSMGLEEVIFMVLCFEVISQFILIEKLKDLLDGKVRVLLYVLIYMLSLPLQYFGIFSISFIMGWDFSKLEVICVMIGGGARIFSVYTLNIVKNKSFNLLLAFDIVISVLAVLIVLLFGFAFLSDQSPLTALTTFFGVEAIIGIGFVLWFELRSSRNRPLSD